MAKRKSSVESNVEVCQGLASRLRHTVVSKLDQGCVKGCVEVASRLRRGCVEVASRLALAVASSRLNDEGAEVGAQTYTSLLCGGRGSSSG